MCRWKQPKRGGARERPRGEAEPPEEGTKTQHQTTHQRPTKDQPKAKQKKGQNKTTTKKQKQKTKPHKETENKRPIDQLW